MSCWGSLFSGPSENGGQPPHSQVGALISRLVSQQRQSAELKDAGRIHEAYRLLKVIAESHAQDRMHGRLLCWLLT